RFRRSFAVGLWPPVHWFGQAHLKLRSRTLSAPFSLCHPDSVRSQIVSFLRLQTMADSDFPHGRRYYTKSGYFQHLEDVTIDRFLAVLATIPSPETHIELTYLGGAGSHVAADETA